jgi:hypothetical protein
MAISLNPANVLDILGFLLKRKKESREKVVEYVESIAEEASSLAAVWQKLFDELASGATVSLDKDPALASEIRKYSQPNAPHYTRLMEFYNWASAALGDKLDTYHRASLADHLGGLLRTRDITLQSYRESYDWLERRRGGQALFCLDSASAGVDVRDLAQSVAALHREAAALHVLAKTLRASG